MQVNIQANLPKSMELRSGNEKFNLKFMDFKVEFH